jgi:hypothetical protein
MTLFSIVTAIEGTASLVGKVSTIVGAMLSTFRGNFRDFPLVELALQVISRNFPNVEMVLKSIFRDLRRAERVLQDTFRDFPIEEMARSVTSRS